MVYQKKVYRIQSRYFFCQERLLKGKNIYYISDDEENSETGSSSLISNNEDILERFKQSIQKYSNIIPEKEKSFATQGRTPQQSYLLSAQKKELHCDLSLIPPKRVKRNFKERNLEGMFGDKPFQNVPLPSFVEKDSFPAGKTSYLVDDPNLVIFQKKSLKKNILNLQKNFFKKSKPQANTLKLPKNLKSPRVVLPAHRHKELTETQKIFKKLKLSLNCE